MSHILSCWDIVEEGLSRRLELKKDLKALQKISFQNKWFKPDIFFEAALMWENKVIIVTDSKINIIHATENMFAMNGYKQEEVLGKSPDIFQGERTESNEINKIRKAIDKQKPFESIVTNYKKDGNIYKCHIEGRPIFNKEGILVNFVALEKAV